jgi:amino acid adenylation domain-containing protein
MTVREDDSRVPADAGLAALFAAQVRRSPDAIALRFAGESVSYAELDRRARQVAATLRRRGVQCGDVVAVLDSQSAGMVIALLGAIMAGAGYLPLDPAAPRDHVAALLADSRAPVVLTRERHRGVLDAARDGGGRVLYLERDLVPAEDAAAFEPAVRRGDDLAYVIYTSGSTGAPKGVAVAQRGVRRLVRDTNYVALGPADRIAQASNPAFDAATFEIWGALLNGGAVVGVPREALLAPAAFERLAADEGITTLFMTTALFHQYARERPGAFAGLGCVLFGGEACNPRLVRAVLEAGPPRRLLHVYGPTETTTFATFHEVTAVPDGADSVPIGAPIGHTTCDVLDDALQPVPAGATGEIVIGGDGVALGYVNDAELTARRFVPDPGAARQGARRYRTGDQGRFRDGALEILGRLDRQVKIRGFRIELEDVEAALRRNAAVEDAAVIVRDDALGNKQLVAYVVLAPALALAALRAELAARLPAYMVPAAWVQLAALPITANGKLDRAALPAPEDADGAAAGGAPRSFLEQVAMEIWAEVLGGARIGRDAGFAELGGHSLAAMQAAARAQDRLGLEVSARSVFDAITLAGWAEHLAAVQLAQTDPDILVAMLAELEASRGSATH